MAASIADRATRWYTRARERRPLLDHLVLTVEHYTATQGPANAGNITYFGFLAFFPLLAIGFATVGIVSRVYPDAQDALITALGDVFPGIIGEGDGQISVSTFEGAVGTAGLIGLLGLVYAGLNWLSAMRSGFEHAFELAPQEVPNFVVGKLRDLITLAAVGTVLIASVALSTTVTGFSENVRSGLGLDQVPGTGLLPSVVPGATYRVSMAYTSTAATNRLWRYMSHTQASRSSSSIQLRPPSQRTVCDTWLAR